MKQAFVSSTDQGGGKRRAISQARSTVQPVERSHAHHPSGGCSTGFRSGHDGFRSGQRQPMRLFTPCIPVGAQIGDHAAQLGDQRGLLRHYLAGMARADVVYEVPLWSVLDAG